MACRCTRTQNYVAPAARSQPKNAVNDDKTTMNNNEENVSNNNKKRRAVNFSNKSSKNNKKNTNNPRNKNEGGVDNTINDSSTKAIRTSSQILEQHMITWRNSQVNEKSYSKMIREHVMKTVFRYKKYGHVDDQLSTGIWPKKIMDHCGLEEDHGTRELWWKKHGENAFQKGLRMKRANVTGEMKKEFRSE